MRGAFHLLARGASLACVILYELGPFIVCAMSCLIAGVVTGVIK